MSAPHQDPGKQGLSRDTHQIGVTWPVCRSYKQQSSKAAQHMCLRAVAMHYVHTTDSADSHPTALAVLRALTCAFANSHLCLATTMPAGMNTQQAAIIRMPCAI